MAVVVICRREKEGVKTLAGPPARDHSLGDLMYILVGTPPPPLFCCSAQIGAAGDVSVQRGMRTYALCITCAATAGTAEYQVRVVFSIPRDMLVHATHSKSDVRHGLNGTYATGRLYPVRVYAEVMADRKTEYQTGWRYIYIYIYFGNELLLLHVGAR